MNLLCHKNKGKITFGHCKLKYNSYKLKCLKSVNKIKNYFPKSTTNNSLFHDYKLNSSILKKKTKKNNKH